MPLSSDQLTQLKSGAQTISNLVSTLVADTVDPATLQAELDVANATITTLNATITKLNDKVTRILAQVDAADTADTGGDAARAAIRSIAAE